LHGFEETHDSLVGMYGARDRQRDAVTYLQNVKKDFRVNCVINSKNQTEIVAFSDFLAKEIRPRIVNFINFNPHGDWARDLSGTRGIVADLFIVKEQLPSSIQILEDARIGVNVRYYPMCRIAEEYRRCVCNDLHVMYDPYEWDNGTEHTEEAYRKWSCQTSSCIEWKADPCRYCTLINVCGGINKALNCATFGEYPQAVCAGEAYTDSFHYRKDNGLTLQKRGESCTMIL